jgi:hypothetical protein
MRESHTAGPARAAGYNTTLLWSLYVARTGEEPKLVHGLGVSIAPKEDNPSRLLVKIDPPLRPRYWSFLTSLTSGEAVVVDAASVDYAAGTFEIDTPFATDFALSVTIIGCSP